MLLQESQRLLERSRVLTDLARDVMKRGQVRIGLNRTLLQQAADHKYFAPDDD